MNRLVKGLTQLSPPRSAFLKMDSNLKPNFRLWSPAMFVVIFSLFIQQAFIPCFASDLPKMTKLEPTTALRGTEVTVTGEGFPTDPEKIIVQLNGTILNDAPSAANSPQSFVFLIPEKFPLGNYTVRASFIMDDKTIGPIAAAMPTNKGRISVVRDSGAKPKLTSIYPLVSYPQNETFGFSLLGEGFSEIPEDNILLVEGRGEVGITWVEQPPESNKKYDKVHGRFISERQLDFWGIPKGVYSGPLSLRIRVGDAVSEPVSTIFARVSKKIPIIISVIVLVLLGALLYFLIQKGVGIYKIQDSLYGPLRALFLDKSNNTYSLSKFQFYLWTAASVFGYAYLTLSRSLIQWNFEFAPIPENLPGIIFASASTAVIAQGTASAKGAMGAGGVKPSFSDFITTGGVVVAERFQFLVWTLLGVLAFLFLVIARDPGNIQELPKIPVGFLYLMGVSSAGYLGGKLARKPGPIINHIEALKGSLTLKIHGRNLSPDGLIKIGETMITPELLDSKVNKEGRPNVVLSEDQAQEAGFAKVLSLTIMKPEDKWFTEQQTLTLINPDGQKAVQVFNVKGQKD